MTAAHVAGESVRGSCPVVCISTHWCRQSYSWLLLIDTGSHAQLESMLPSPQQHNRVWCWGAPVREQCSSILSKCITFESKVTTTSEAYFNKTISP